MRDVDGKAIIRGDFILVAGDTVSNVDLRPIVEEHRYVHVPVEGGPTEGGTVASSLFQRPREEGQELFHDSAIQTLVPEPSAQNVGRRSGSCCRRLHGEDPALREDQG